MSPLLRLRRPICARGTRRGQALIEFALVFPVFILLMLGFFAVGSWVYNLQGMRHAADYGASAGNQALQPLTARFASDAEVSTPYIPGVNGGSFSQSCRSAANNVNRSGGAYRRSLGWDWGCLYPRSNPRSSSDIGYPLYRATQAAWERLNGGIYIGGTENVVITACYVVYTPGNSVPGCALSVRSTAPGAGSYVGSRPSTMSAAPSFIRVEITGPATLRAMGYSLGGNDALRIRAQQLLDRFLPPCPAPDRAPSGNQYQPGDCGGLF